MKPLTSRNEADTWDSFTFCFMLKFAYEKAFSNHNIKTAFRELGVYPLDPSQVLGVPRSKNAQNIDLMLDVGRLGGQFEEKRSIMRDEVLGSTATLGKNGFVDTSEGEVLTSVKALHLAKAKHQSDVIKREAAERNACVVVAKSARRATERRAENDRLKDLQWMRRARYCGLSVAILKRRTRSTNERRASALLRVLNNRQYLSS